MNDMHIGLSGLQEKLVPITSDPDFADLKIVDVDSHWSEPWDLWTSRVSKSMRNKVPRVRVNDEGRFWVVGEDERVLHRASAISVIGKNADKMYGGDFLASERESVHEAAYNMTSRLQFMDALGIHTQICYPNVGGVGFGALKNDELEVRQETVRAYNDAVFEFQAETNNRILPMTVMPFWDVKEAVKELERCRALGSHGIVIGGDVQASGVPSLGSEYWDPLFEACVDQDIPINFHIGASEIANMICRERPVARIRP
ncbi:MAG: amidohydrolase family protein [Hahellaceae bacterium]|nr:amidohydrolase family protein [Hahellaceae bacterium]